MVYSLGDSIYFFQRCYSIPNASIFPSLFQADLTAYIPYTSEFAIVFLKVANLTIFNLRINRENRGRVAGLFYGVGRPKSIGQITVYEVTMVNKTAHVYMRRFVKNP